MRTLAAGSAVITAIVVAVVIGMPRRAIGMPGLHRVYDVSAGTALVSEDGRSITVGDFLYWCNHPASLVVSESPRAVSLIERTARDTPALACSAGLAPGLLTVRLREPLGLRALIDGTTRRPMAWFDQRHELRRAHLPAALSPRPPAIPFAYPFAGVPPRPACTQLFDLPGFGWLTVTRL